MNENQPAVLSTLRVRLLHITYFFAFGFFIPYLTLYFSRILLEAGGDGAEGFVGVLVFVHAGAGVFALPVAGYLADRFRIESRLIAVCALSVAAGGIVLAFPAFVPGLGFSAVLATLLAGALICGFFTKPMIPLIDTVTLKHLRSSGASSSEYGSFRMGGSFGFVLSAVAAGVVLSITGMIGMTVALHAAGFLFLAWIARRRLPAHLERVKIPWHHLRQDRIFKRFIVFAFFASMGVNTAFLFTGLFLDQIEAGFLIMGFVFAASAAPEIPVMRLAGRFIRRFGARRVIAVGLVSQIVKLVLFTVFAESPSTWIFIVVSVLHGVGFALLLTGSVEFVDRQAHPDMRATYQNLFQLLWGSAIAIGGPVSGFIVSYWDATTLMAACAGLLILTLLYLGVVVRGKAGYAAVQSA